MEISLMVSELRNQIAGIEPEVSRLTLMVNEMEMKLSETRAALTQKMDRLTAMRMAVESLEILDVRPDPRPEPAPDPVQCRPKYSRKPKRIVKADSKGATISTFSSINQCAKAMGWTNTGTKKYIETVSREKQIKLRGYSLAYAE